jgi:hypothetical protein
MSKLLFATVLSISFVLPGLSVTVPRKCQMPGTLPAPGLDKCLLGASSGGATDQGDDPDMEGREGVPPDSVGSGTR